MKPIRTVTISTPQANLGRKIAKTFDIIDEKKALLERYQKELDGLKTMFRSGIVKRVADTTMYVALSKDLCRFSDYIVELTAEIESLHIQVSKDVAELASLKETKE